MQRKTLSGWLTSKYLLIIRDEENFAEKGTYSFNIVRIFLIFLGAFIVLSGISFLLATTLLATWFDPRAEYLQINRQLVEMETQVDSLMYAMEIKDNYINNIQAVIKGEVTLDDKEKSEEGETPISVNDIDLQSISPVDSVFRQEFEDVDYDLLTYKNSLRNELQEIYFLTPVEGVVSNRYNVPERHFGVDLVAKKDEPIKAIADGTVMVASWTQDSGYVIGIQHKNNILSFYKHNSSLLKEVGEVVKAGDLIAIIGNTGELTDGPHLHLELWYNGNPVNPEEFIPF